MNLFLRHLSCATLATVLVIHPTDLRAAPDAPASVAVGAQPATPLAFEQWLVAPVRVHLLNSSQSPALSTTLIETDIARILAKVNRVWAAAGICFYLESIVHEAPVAFSGVKVPGDLKWLLNVIPEASYRREAFNLYYVKEFPANGVFLGKAIFVKDSAALQAVEGGIDEPIPRVTSHELGHALSLRHRQDRTNLMASGTTGTLLNAAEIAAARERAAHFAWITPAAALLSQADALRGAGKMEDSRVLYARLASIPGPDETLTRIRRLATE